MSATNNSTSSATNFTTTSKGRIASKLSSRNNRRRRRSGENKERSKKSSRRRRNNNERVPIPSFTPIKEEFSDCDNVDGSAECASELLSKVKESSLSNDKLSGDENECIKCIEITSSKVAANVKGAASSRDDISTDQTNDEHNNQEHTKQHTTYIKSDENQIIEPNLQIKQLHVEDKNNSLSCTVQEEKAVNNNKLIKETDVNDKQCAAKIHVPTTKVDGELRKEEEPSLKEESLHLDNSSSIKKSTASRGSSENDVKANVKQSKYFVDEPAKKKDTESVIEILDDDDEHDNDINSEKPTTKRSAITKKDGGPNQKQKPNKANQTKKKKRKATDEEGDELVHADVKKAKKPSKKRNQTKKVTKSDSTTTTDATGDTQKKGKTAAQKKKQSKTKLCFACSSCKCNTRSGTDATPQKFSSLSGSDARQEQTLANRLQRIERNIAWNEGQRNDVARDLKKHRGQMNKRFQSSNNSAEKPRFLADVDTIDELGVISSKMESDEVYTTNSRIFGSGNGKTHQPTLTQIMRGPNDDDDGGGDDADDAAKEVQDDAIKPIHQEATSPDSGGDGFLSFLGTNIVDATRCLGTMGDFNHAITQGKLNTVTSNGLWATSVRNKLQIEQDEGFDALVSLFDSSIDGSKNATHCSQQNDDDDTASVENSMVTSPVQQDLTPRGKQVKEEIETSVKSEKLTSIERMCPNWKGNVTLAQAQTNPDVVSKALDNVKRAKADLECMKERILQAFLDRQQTLELYELSFQSSLDRISIDNLD